MKKNFIVTYALLLIAMSPQNASSQNAPVPSISSLGLGCSSNQCIWVRGSAFGTNCSVRIFAGDWSDGTVPAAIITSSSGAGLRCANDLVTFEIPASIRNRFATVNVSVVNHGISGPGQFWSEPRSLAISSIGLLTFNGELMNQYFTLGQRRAALIVTEGSGAGYTQWATAPVAGSPWRTDMVWGSPAQWPAPPGQPVYNEEFDIKNNCTAGKNFVWLHAFRNDNPNGTRDRFKLVTTRAEIQVGGMVTDITSGGSCGLEGQPYMLNDVSTVPYIIRVWGDILMADGITIGRKFFWQAQYTHNPALTNNCWAGSGSKTRPAVEQIEAWWDSTHGWSIGSGTLGPDGIPDGRNVVMPREQSIAKGLGGGWRAKDAGQQICMQHQWAY